MTSSLNAKHISTYYNGECGIYRDFHGGCRMMISEFRVQGRLHSNPWAPVIERDMFLDMLLSQWQSSHAKHYLSPSSPYTALPKLVGWTLFSSFCGPILNSQWTCFRLATSISSCWKCRLIINVCSNQASLATCTDFYRNQFSNQKCLGAKQGKEYNKLQSVGFAV